MMSLPKSLAKLIFAQYVFKSSQHPIKSYFSASILTLIAIDSADTFRRSTFLSTTLGVCGKKEAGVDPNSLGGLIGLYPSGPWQLFRGKSAGQCFSHNTVSTFTVTLVGRLLIHIILSSGFLWKRKTWTFSWFKSYTALHQSVCSTFSAFSHVITKLIN